MDIKGWRKSETDAKGEDGGIRGWEGALISCCSVRLRRWNKFVGGGGDNVAAPAVKLPDCW